ncbi:unnamed protein product [Soboliphyme baturini]|uniref:VGCC_alpha2 domain-containing protein n=1 Tax=Soboliphyme baturini TaxID=241478 RepID=A0A183J9R5_9BILA|nr:unnamed protein product [Soboliphyme baturini]
MTDNKSAVVTASRAVFLEDSANHRAPAVVVGFEMLYLSFEEMMLNASNKVCRPGSSIRCYLLDEHGYVIYASPPQDIREEMFYLRSFFGRLSLEHTVNGGVERFLMKKLVDKYVYKEVTFVDFQALCLELHLPSFSKRLMNPFLSLVKLLFWCSKALYNTIIQCSFWSLISGLIARINGYTPTFHDIHEGLACDKASSFYLLNKDFRGPVTLSEDKVLCTGLNFKETSYQKKISCNLKAYAVRIKKTNLVLVVYNSDNGRCDDDLCKLHFMRSTVPFEFTVLAYATDKLVHSSGCKTISARYRRSPSVCYAIDDHVSCSKCCSVSL